MTSLKILMLQESVLYFSPQKFRRAKTLAGQMGIETGWNSSISLQDREHLDKEPNKSPSLSPEKKISSGSNAVAGDWHHTDDWDEKAQLPHGIKEIRHHLDMIDNVPLLVQLFKTALQRLCVR